MVILCEVIIVETVPAKLRELVKKLKSERLESAIKEDALWGLHGK